MLSMATIVAAAGGLSVASGVASALFARIRPWLIGGALLALAVASAAVAVWIKDLQARSLVATQLEARETTLSADMGCAKGEDVLACHRRLQTEAAQAHAEALRKQAQAAASEQARLAAERDQLAATLSDLDAQADADADAADKLPAAIGRAWDAKRKAMGAK